jgi:hypothetical protein
MQLMFKLSSIVHILKKDKICIVQFLNFITTPLLLGTKSSGYLLLPEGPKGDTYS